MTRRRNHDLWNPADPDDPNRPLSDLLAEWVVALGLLALGFILVGAGSGEGTRWPWVALLVTVLAAIGCSIGSAVAARRGR